GFSSTNALPGAGTGTTATKISNNLIKVVVSAAASTSASNKFLDRTTQAALSLSKSASPTTYTGSGQSITYTYIVTNTGNVALAGPVTVTDDKATVTCPAVNTVGNLDANLDPGESITCTATYTTTAADVTAKSVTNHATASASGTSSNQASATINLRALSLSKRARKSAE